jgi:hypothetical protein
MAARGTRRHVYRMDRELFASETGVVASDRDLAGVGEARRAEGAAAATSTLAVLMRCSTIRGEPGVGRQRDDRPRSPVTRARGACG